MYFASDLNSNINIEKTSIQRLLRLGLKIKLTDIDLTDYLGKKCKHMLKFDTSESFDIVNAYLKKENELSLEEEENDDASISESLDENFYDKKQVKPIQLKSSSLFSNMKKSSSSETSFVSKEQIIGYEIKIILTTTIKMSSKTQSKNYIFLCKNEIVSTTQVEEDKLILCVDAKKFTSEFNTMIKNSKFCDCSLYWETIFSFLIVIIKV
ncbi:unnamed protein product [Brachionus calyciflorus]|uniref:Uncharacterized protein n=1 Tax=Brachionus calyciflorus TaxID=104777 RepID=A0A814HQ25_9BILA|nr:unnamed protein product [Brachionus calyciflorus]